MAQLGQSDNPDRHSIERERTNKSIKKQFASARSATGNKLRENIDSLYTRDLLSKFVIGPKRNGRTRLKNIVTPITFN